LIPTPEQLQQVSQLRAGSLAEVPFGALLLALAVERRTLVLEVRRKQMSKRIMLEHGVPIDCRSNLVHETLGRFMVGLGKIVPEDLHSYLSQSAAGGLPLGEVLLDNGVVTAEELYKLLQQNLAKKLLDVFSWRDGEFRVHDEMPHPESSLKVRVPQLIVTGITKFAQQEEVDAGVVPLVGKKLCLHPDPPYPLEEIRLNQRQGQVAVALRSGWRIDELALGTGMPFEELTRLLYALSVLGAVVTEDHPAAKAALRAARLTNPNPNATAAPQAAAAGQGAAPAPVTGAPPGGAAQRPGSAAAPGPAGGPVAVDAPPVPDAGAAGRPAEASPHVVPFPAAAAAAVDAAPPAPAARPSAPAALTEITAPPGGRPAAPEAGPRAAVRSPLRVASTATRAIAIPPPLPLAPEELATGTQEVPTPAEPASPAELPPALERRRNEIMQSYLSYRRLDAFDLLGTDEDASPAAIESRYLDFAERFAPWTMRQPGMADMEEKVSDLFLAGARAYVELLDLERRNVLLFRRRTARDERTKRSPAGDALAIKTDLLDPEVQYRKGQALMEAGKFQDAALLLEFASDCDPANGLYSAELAYCRFCIAPGQGSRALKDLQDTLRRDPRCGLAVYYSGEIHRQMGKRDEAEALLRRAIKMMAPDRRPIDALKLLSAEKHK
jgi:Domain of unknown function (DUF4388)